MVDEISLIGWRNDIGAFLIMQHPRQIPISTQDIMQIYTQHRQNTLYPNFITLKDNRGKNTASFFSGMKTTEYVGAPNFIVSLSLDESESPTVFKDLLPEISAKILIKLFNMFPKLLEELQDVEGIIFFSVDEDIGIFPILNYPDGLQITSKFKSGVLEEFKKARESAFEIDGQNVISFFMGAEKETHSIVPNCIIVYLLGNQIDPATLRKKLSKISRVILKEFSNLLAKALGEINDRKLELMIEENLKESPLIAERDLVRISEGDEEPDVLGGEEGGGKKGLGATACGSESTVDQMLEKIREKTEIKVEALEKERVAEKQIGDMAATQEELLNQIYEKDELINELQGKIAELADQVAKREKELKKMKKLLKSLKEDANHQNGME